ncbi:right-handed parallel beta-helix repeat-containing protein [Rossellomorea sp. H39__3]
MKTLAPYKGANVLFDGKNEKGNLLNLNADYWVITGFELTKSTGNGMRVNGSHNKIDHMTFSYNQNTGFQISGSGSDPELWPKHNLISNSESHDNRDSSDINADGFAAKLGVGEGNVFKNNISHHNIDDGWDLYNRTNEGANKPVTLDGNISYSNGKLSSGYNEDGTSGSGFKVGGEGLPVAHIVKNNLAFDNNMDGFTDNFNPGKIIVHKNIAIDNKRYNFIFRINPYFKPEEQGIFTKNISIKTDPDRLKGDFVSGVVDDSNYFFDGERTVNSKGDEKDPKPYLKKLRP